ncbi:kinase-like protein [Melanomma pulvis-pyrius CBS 109.77]|uniref:Kinase-like protein n=1 Tax=Melanomma pulvis-pyrius CBS 109.77 TaxID=1314802 RepID=A0A6A6XSE2_9PLEO|nr:kinase-like protein [Melanomma pulvis-pyrius CBS 109.77]
MAVIKLTGPRIRAKHCITKRSSSLAKPKSKPTTTFVWRPKDWATKKEVTQNVSILSNRTSTKVLVVKKVLRMRVTADDLSDTRPLEVRILSKLPNSNRVAKVLFYADQDPDPTHGTAVFEHYPLGDLMDWKVAVFDNKNFKSVPESYIWRFFVQMAQALAFIQNEIGPRRDERQGLIHRDLKPKNILVCNNGTTYPSFKMHDFDCAIEHSLEKGQSISRCGTFEWQPPENPRINTPMADIWSLGACVHYLALGTAPVESVAQYTADTIKQGGGQHPAAVAEYSYPRHYYDARVPRKVTPINLSQQEQRARGLAPYNSRNRAPYNHMYSDELNDWMEQTLNYSPKKRPSASRLVYGMSLEARGMLKKLAGQSGLVDMDINYGG